MSIEQFSDRRSSLSSFSFFLLLPSLSTVWSDISHSQILSFRSTSRTEAFLFTHCKVHVLDHCKVIMFEQVRLVPRYSHTAVRTAVRYVWVGVPTFWGLFIGTTFAMAP